VSEEVTGSAVLGYSLTIAQLSTPYTNSELYNAQRYRDDRIQIGLYDFRYRHSQVAYDRLIN